MTSRRLSPRFYARLGCLAAAILLASPSPLWIHHAKIVVRASPFVTICTLMAGGTLGVGSILGIGFSITALFRKRWFCRYVCPVGFILDGAAGIGFHKSEWWRGSPSIGRYIALVTAAGAVIGYPLMVWMDPLVLFNSSFSIYSEPGIAATLLSTAGVAALVLTAVTSGSLWCTRICPLGATQDLLADIGAIPGRFKSGSKKKSSLTKTAPEYSFPVTRRMLLTVAAGIGVGVLAKKSAGANTDRAVLRPPGSLEEDTFAGMCLRCGNCVRACPSGIIQPDVGETGILGFMTPVLRFKNGYCLESCSSCTEVCPSGALEKLPLERKIEYKIGKAVLNPSLCFMVLGISDCDICIRSCPFEAVQAYWDEEAYIAVPVVDPLKCNGCGACERYCPTGGVKAIQVLQNR